MAARANSPRDGLNTPLPLVMMTSLAISSGKRVRSRPAEREWTQRTLGEIRKTSRIRESEPDQLKMISALSPALAKALVELPIATVALSRNSSSLESCGSSGADKTRIESFSLRRPAARRAHREH